MFNWCISYVTNIFQRVFISGDLTDWFEILTGVSQSSILGPCFLMFTNDTVKYFIYSESRERPIQTIMKVSSKGVRALRGYFGSPMRSKNKSSSSQVSSY